MSELSVGSGISTAVMKKDTSVTDHLARYVFNPMLRIDLTDRNITGAMSQSSIVQGHISNLVDCPYKVRDESSDMLLSQTSEDEFFNSPLTEHIHTAKNQADYLESSYSSKGVVVLHDLTGLSPDEVILIEEAVLGRHFDTVIELSRYLADSNAVKENLKNSGADKETLRLARKIVPALTNSVSQALKYATDWISESKAEIIGSRNNKAGKSSHDPFDMEMYRQTGLPPLKERDIDYADAANKAENSGNKELAEAIKLLAENVNSGDKKAEDNARVEVLEAQLAEMRQMIAALTQPAEKEDSKK